MTQTGLLQQAWELASRAADRSRVAVHQISGPEVAAVQQLIGEAWGVQQVPQSNLLHALSHSGNTVLIGTRGDSPVGVSFGFLGWRGGLHLHSHMTAVTKRLQSNGVGYALKLAQRAHCLEHGVTEMRWTYDPLIARNAYFNLTKLGARVQAFYPDFYGAMDDVVNAGDHSDRFEVSWQLDSDEVITALDQHKPDPAHPDGERFVIPADFDSLRREDPATARQLRLTARRDFARLFAAGQRPDWREGVYVFTPAESRPHGAEGSTPHG